MKLQSKLAILNTVSKLLIVLLFVVFLPYLARKTALTYTDNKLVAIKEKIMHIIQRKGISEYIEMESDSTFSSYNILKEEFISIEAVQNKIVGQSIENSIRDIDNEDVDYRVLSYVFKYDNQLYLLEAGKSVATIKQLDATLNRLAILTIFITLAITFIIETGFTRVLLKPFQFIIDKLKGINHPESFEFSLTKTSTSDFIQLDESINEMMTKISGVFNREREFIANVSHELITPISILQTRIENILSAENISEEHAIRLVDSQVTLSRMNKIIKTLLLISRIENQQYLKKDTVSVKETLNEVIKETEDRMETKSITVELNMQDDLIMTQCNQSLIFTLLFNLVSNAIKYNVQHGKVFVRGRNTEHHYELEIEDSGRGISPDRLPHIFDRFVKFGQIDSDSQGLGLPIVKTIAKFHDIEIFVNSIEKKGTCFRLIFPFNSF